MKRLLLAVVGIMFAATIFAQNGLVASLSHGTDITYFYGVNALQLAVDNAKSGDIINLSGGSFNPNRSLGPISSGDVKVFSCSPESKECLPLIYGSHKT